MNYWGKIMREHNHYRIKYSDVSGNHHIIKSTVFTFEDAENWASDREQLHGVCEHREGLEPTNPQIQVWEFEEITGVAARFLDLIRG